MTAPTIRLARPGDERGIHEAHMRSIREICSSAHEAEEIVGWGNRPFGDRWDQPIREGHVWVVELRSTVHGVAYIRTSPSSTSTSAHIFSLYLTPEVVGQGFGARLMRLMLDAAKAAGVRSITLDSTLNAHEFYERFGFRDAGPVAWRRIGGSLVRGHPMVLSLEERTYGE